MSTQYQHKKYMPQLDALRAFAVILVLMHHWLPEESVLNFTPNGTIGVTLFFVLSGFLISKILFHNRIAIAEERISAKSVIWRFYMRRSLRIFPIYFIVIFLCYNFSVESIQENFAYFVTYTTNILNFTSGNWMGSLSHLWTLSVEEQYYLVIPFFLIFLPQKYLLRSIWIFILLGPLSRLVIFGIYGEEHLDIRATVLTFSAMDCFSLGTLLAYMRTYGDAAQNKKFDNWLWSVFLLAGVSFLFLITLDQPVLSSLFMRLLLSFISLYLIDLAAKGVEGKAKLVLENPVILHLGKISYGIYLLHMFVPGMWDYVSDMFFQYAWIRWMSESWVRFLLFFVITVGLATFSWFCIEKPINQLKDYFRYDKQILSRFKPYLAKLNVGILVITLFFLYPQFPIKGLLGSKLEINRPDLLPGKSTGLYLKDFNKIVADSSYQVADDLPIQTDIISIYLAWGDPDDDKQNFNIPVHQIRKLEKQGKQVFITWEPWTATFTDVDINNHDVHEAIHKGKLDFYLQEQAKRLNSLQQPVYIRWGHNVDKLDCPWSAITKEEIAHYKKAHVYLQQYFNDHAPGKIKWVWPAPGVNRIEQYIPDNYQMDFVGCPGINKGVNKEDERWKSFSDIYDRYAKKLNQLSQTKDVPVFITEAGMTKRSRDQQEWLQQTLATLKEKEEISHCVFFIFHESILDPNPG